MQAFAASYFRPMPVLSNSRRLVVAVAAVLSLTTLSSCSDAGSRSATAAGSRPMTKTEKDAIADTLRGMIERAYDLTTPGDKVARLMSLYPASGPVVSASAGQVTTSRDSLQGGIRAFWDNVGRNMRDPKWTWDEMHVDVLARDAAVITATYHVPHKTPRGDPHTIAGAMTVAFERIGGRWGVVQEHLSDLAPSQPGDTTAGDMASMPAEHHH